MLWWARPVKSFQLASVHRTGGGKSVGGGGGWALQEAAA